MSKGVNKVILVGRVGQDPEVHNGQNGVITNLNLATSEVWKDKQTGEKKEKTEWHRVVAYGRQAEIARDYVKKGAQLYVEGRLQTRKWQDQSGKDQYTTEIVMTELQMLGGGSGSGGQQQMVGGQQQQQQQQQAQQPQPAPQQQQQQQQPQPQPAPQQQAQPQPQAQPAPQPQPAPQNDFDDDIPF